VVISDAKWTARPEAYGTSEICVVSGAAALGKHVTLQPGTAG
jgi:hypothetical protein